MTTRIPKNNCKSKQKMRSNARQNQSNEYEFEQATGLDLKRYDVKEPRNHTARNATKLKFLGVRDDSYVVRCISMTTSSFACDVICCFAVYGDFIHLSTSQKKRHLSQLW